MVRVFDCDSKGCEFEPRQSPHFTNLYGRGILVVQQSPKLPYESSILSVRAIHARRVFYYEYSNRLAQNREQEHILFLLKIYETALSYSFLYKNQFQKLQY